MSKDDEEVLALWAFKIVIWLLFGVVIALFWGFRNHPKATSILLVVAVALIVVLSMSSGY